MNAAGYRDRIGKGVEDSVVEQARDVLQDADILPVYNHFKVELAFEAFFPYPYGKVVADAWLAKPGNLERVAAVLGRTIKQSVGNKDNKGLLYWCFCRAKSLGFTNTLDRGIRGVLEEAIVMIALDPWEEKNAPLVDIPLEAGQGICFGGTERIPLSGQGGCRMLMMILDMPPATT
ncbi:hypothetical protein LTR54_017321 [Friedmanniomyces endolithicus]|nr:hypothetical protein LTR54_017321 [Friedmanniomyces endolithicus]